MRPLSHLCRVGLALVVFLLVLGVLRWSPVYAEPPWDVRALPLAALAVLLACATALTGTQRRTPSLRPALALLSISSLGLVAVLAVRPQAGLPAEVRDPAGIVGVLPPGPVEVSGGRLRALPAVRRWNFRWSGPLHVPRTGTYRFWVTGRGRVEVTLGGRLVLQAESDPLRAGQDIFLGRGSHHLEVVFHRTGAGPRLRLGWTHPGGLWNTWDELIAPRYLGERSAGFLWRLTDILCLGVAGGLALLVFLIPWDRPRRLASPGPLTWREVLISLAAHAALVSLMSWPLPANLAASGVVDRPDGRLNTWILAWDVNALLSSPGRLFQAPIFHPLPDALAFSENLVLPAILAAPFVLLGGPVLGYNVVLLGSMVLSGLGTQLLVRRVSGDRLAAFVAGCIFAVGSHRWVRLAHLQAQVTLFLPFVLLAFDRFWEKRTFRRALAVGSLFALQGLSSIYVGAMTALVLAVAVLVALMGGLKLKELVRLMAGLALASLMLAPLARPYLRMRAFQGIEWTMEDVGTYATTLASYAASGTRLYGGLTQRHLDPEVVQDTLFPGLVPLLLGLAGIAGSPRRYRAVAILATSVAVVVSLGPQTAFYRFLHEHLVFVRGVRALSRFSLIGVLALAVLSGLALAGRRRLIIPSLVLFLFESTNAPLRYAAYGGPSEASRWLANQPGGVVYLPLGERDTEAMLEGVAHFRPLVNGDSGFIPRPYNRAMELLGAPLSLSEDALRFLRASGVRHIVTQEPQRLPLAAAPGGEFIYEVPPGEGARPVSASAPYPTVWSDEGVVVDLGRLVTVDFVAFELGEGPWLARPRLQASEDGHMWQELEGVASLADAVVSLYRDPQGALGAVRFAPQTARYLRLPLELPLRLQPLRVGASTGP